MRPKSRREDTSKKRTVEKPHRTKTTKKTYRPPVLENFGAIDALTLGGQGGAGDGHGGPNTRNPCWIAEVLYGVDDNRTRLLRAWLTGIYARTAVGAPVVALYRGCGERVAAWARRSALLRRILTPLFDAGVAAARRHYARPML